MGAGCDGKKMKSNLAFSRKIQKFLLSYSIKTRPFAGPGEWFLFLLPGILVVNRFKYSDLTDIYTLSSVLSTGLLITSVIQLLAIYSADKKKIHSFNSGMFFPLMFAVFHLHFRCERGMVFSLVCGILISYGFSIGFLKLMKLCPLCFTFGEAAVITQAAILFLISGMENIYEAWNKPPEYDMDIATLILQVGFIGVFVICAILLTTPDFRSVGPFYAVTFGILCLVVIPALHLLLRRNPVLWIISLIWTEDTFMPWMFGYWILCVVAAALAVVVQIHIGQHATTSIRKYFHILAVAIYLPGLIKACCLLYLASGIVLAVFVVLEIVRLLNIPPLAKSLQEGFAIYADEKDAGNLALTPIYLLVGCSLPLWLHPFGCSHSSSILPLCSGLLSVGIGDTLASSIGSHFGRHKWPGSQKTIEGSLACAFGQIVAVIIMAVTGIVQITNWIPIVVGVTVTSLVEAKTDQVDNLLLPLVTFLVI